MQKPKALSTQLVTDCGYLRKDCMDMLCAIRDNRTVNPGKVLERFDAYVAEHSAHHGCFKPDSLGQPIRDCSPLGRSSQAPQELWYVHCLETAASFVQSRGTAQGLFERLQRARQAAALKLIRGHMTSPYLFRYREEFRACSAAALNDNEQSASSLVTGSLTDYDLFVTTEQLTDIDPTRLARRASFIPEGDASVLLLETIYATLGDYEWAAKISRNTELLKKESEATKRRDKPPVLHPLATIHG
jgi:hypothetical protein